MNGTSLVYVYIGTGVFPSLEAMASYFDPGRSRSRDGELVDFVGETWTEHFEPGRIECLWLPEAVGVRELLWEASYSEQWIGAVEESLKANAAICVYPPNLPRRPEESSLRFVGAFPVRLAEKA